MSGVGVMACGVVLTWAAAGPPLVDEAPAVDPPLAFSQSRPGDSAPATQPAAAPPVAVKLAMVNKDELAGRLLSLGGGQLTLEATVAPGTVLTLRLEQVTRLTIERPPRAKPIPRPEAAQTVRLKDGSLLIGRFVALTSQSLRFEPAGIGPLDLPRPAVAEWTCDRQAAGQGGITLERDWSYDGQGTVRIYHVKQADVRELAKILNQLFEPIEARDGRQRLSVVADQRTNSLIVVGTAEQHKKIKELIQQLDGNRVTGQPVAPAWAARRPRPPGSEPYHVVCTRAGDVVVGNLEQPEGGKLKVSGAAVEATFAVASLASIDFPMAGPVPATQPDGAAWAVETTDGMRLVGCDLELRAARLWLTVAGGNRVGLPIGRVKAVSPAGAESIGRPVTRGPSAPPEIEGAFRLNRAIPEGNFP